MSVIINPNTEPVEDTTEENAIQSMGAFIVALCVERGLDELEYGRRADIDRNGRYGFCLYYSWDSWYRPSIMVMMPGCDPERVQSSTPWRSPRLYVDGESWLWSYALDIAESRLGGSGRNDA